MTFALEWLIYYIAYLRGIRSLIVLAFFLVFLGVVYQVGDSMSTSEACC